MCGFSIHVRCLSNPATIKATQFVVQSAYSIPTKRRKLEDREYVCRATIRRTSRSIRTNDRSMAVATFVKEQHIADVVVQAVLSSRVTSCSWYLIFSGMTRSVNPPSRQSAPFVVSGSTACRLSLLVASEVTVAAQLLSNVYSYRARAVPRHVTRITTGGTGHPRCVGEEG